MHQFTNEPHSCPVCRQPVSFGLADTNLLVCSFCKAVVTRTLNSNALSLTNFRGYPEKIVTRHLHVGSKGVFQGKHFEIIGAAFSVFNYANEVRWQVRYENGTLANWVETAAQLYEATPQSVDFASQLPLVPNKDVGMEMFQLLKGSNMHVFEKLKGEYTYFEGALVWKDNDALFHVYRIRDQHKKQYEVIVWSKSLIELYLLKPIEGTDLKLKESTSSRTVHKPKNCGKCGTPYNLTNVLFSRHFVCSSCQSWNKIEKENITVASKKLKEFKPTLLVGAIGRINEIDYKVIGVSKKNEAGSISTFWLEYVLFSEKNGYAWLSEYNGHWIFLTEDFSDAAWPHFSDRLQIDFDNYYLYLDYSYHIVGAQGEFLDPLLGENRLVREYISPPTMYSAEIFTGANLSWYRGTHIAPSSIAQGFNIEESSLPVQYGIGAVQPLRFHANQRILSLVAMLVLVVMFAVQLFFHSKHAQTEVFRQSFMPGDSIPAGGYISPSFELKPNSGNLQLSLYSPVDNSWFEAAITLVNDKTGAEINFEKGVEYYHGFSDGESWEEGSKETELIISRLPKGSYHLNIFPSFGIETVNRSYTISVVSDVPMWRNFIIVACLLALYPLLMWARNQIVERRRWFDNDNSPYKIETDE